VESFGGDIRAFHGGTFPGLWVLQIGQAFGLIPGLFTRPAASHPRKGKPLARAGRKAMGRARTCPLAAAGCRKGERDCRKAFRLTFEDEEVRTNR